MTKKHRRRALARFESGRDIWQEVLDGVRQIKAGRGKRLKVEPRSPIVAGPLEVRTNLRKAAPPKEPRRGARF